MSEAREIRPECKQSFFDLHRIVNGHSEQLTAVRISLGKIEEANVHAAKIRSITLETLKEVQADLAKYIPCIIGNTNTSKEIDDNKTIAKANDSNWWVKLSQRTALVFTSLVVLAIVTWVLTLLKNG